MKINLIAFGIAKDILGQRKTTIEISDNSQISDLKNTLVEEFPEFGKLVKLSFAINETYQTDDFRLSANEEVVIIPPVAGG
ncbi:MAG: MoaD/ThiS family protein [Saprospiraceae bacterium]|jgi:molybdopterin converting factor small subunit